jgi:predicted RNA binding protein YcfA (HicA-like mRNA interferase family)
MAGSKGHKLLRKLLSGSKNIRFSDVVACAEAFGFRLDRVSGSHRIFVHPEVREILNLQNVKGKAKPYQVRQLIGLIERYDLRSNDT